MSQYTIHTGGSSSSGHKGGGGTFGFLGKVLGGAAKGVTNLGSDLKDAVVGIPTGLVMTAEHPVRAAQAIGRSTWHDWAPLIEGHPGEWAKQTYDHPLAPLLDVATVFSAGAAGAARFGAALDAAGSESKLASSLADLGRPSSRLIYDTKGKALDDAAAAAKAEKAGVRGTLPKGRYADRTAGEAGRSTEASYDGRGVTPNARAVPREKNSGLLPEPAHTVAGGRVDAAPDFEWDKPMHVPDVSDAGRAARAAAKASGDTQFEGKPLLKTYGASAGANARRLLANRALMHLEPHLPAWFSQGARDARVYGRLQHVEDAHKLIAQGAQIKGLMAAGKAITDPAAVPTITRALLSHNYANFLVHAAPKSTELDLKAGERYVTRIDHTNSHLLDYNPKNPDLAQRMDQFGRDFTTTDPAMAATRNGKRLVIRTDAAKAAAQEGGNSTRFLRKLAHNPTMLWKRIQVGYAPRVITNNTVGNWFMYAMRTTGDQGARGLVDAVKYAHGTRAAMRSFKDMHAHIEATQGAEAGAKFTAIAHPSLYNNSTFENGRLVPAVDSHQRITEAFGPEAAAAVQHSPDWIKAHFKDEINEGLGHAVLGQDDLTKAGEVAGKTRQALRSGLYPIVHRVADQPVRVASLYQFMRTSPEVKAFLKTHPGTKLDEAIHKTLEDDAAGHLSENAGALRERAVQHVRKIAGDYTTVSPTEKLIQNIMPFYLWDKHIVKHFGNMLSEKPGRIALMQKQSQMGDAESAKLLGDLPSFMKGALPLSLLGLDGKDGRTPILAPSGLNPYNTAGDLAKLATSLTTDPSATAAAEAGGNLSPVLSGLIEAISGKKIGTDAPISRHGGIVPSILGNMAESTSYGTLLKTILSGTPQPKVTAGTATHPFGSSKPFLYDKSKASTIEGLFGLPIKQASLARAKEMADAETGQHKKKRTNSNPFGR